MNLREERLGAGRCQGVESGVQVAEGHRHQAALDRALTQQEGKKSCWQIWRERQKAVAGQGMGRAAGKEVVPVGCWKRDGGS